MPSVRLAVTQTGIKDVPEAENEDGALRSQSGQQCEVHEGGLRPERLRAFLSFWLSMREDYSRLVKIDNHHE